MKITGYVKLPSTIGLANTPVRYPISSAAGVQGHGQSSTQDNPLRRSAVSAANAIDKTDQAIPEFLHVARQQSSARDYSSLGNREKMAINAYLEQQDFQAVEEASTLRQLMGIDYYA